MSEIFALIRPSVYVTSAGDRRDLSLASSTRASGISGRHCGAVGQEIRSEIVGAGLSRTDPLLAPLHSANPVFVKAAQKVYRGGADGSRIVF